MTRILSIVLAVVLGVLLVSAVANAVTTISTNVVTGGTLAVTGASTLTGDVTMDGGNGALVITTANTATSTIQVGCVQMYATSTATALHLEFNAQATTTFNGASNGSVAWKYGACPV